MICLSITQVRKRHININVLVRLRLGRPPVCPWDKPSLSQGQTQVAPGTNPGFLLILHSGSPSLSLGQTQFVPAVCPWDKPSLSLGQTSGEWRQNKFMCQMFMCLFLLLITDAKSEIKSLDFHFIECFRGRRRGWLNSTSFSLRSFEVIF